MLAALQHRFAAATPDAVLPMYRQPVHPWKLKLRNRGALAALALLGLFYGVAVAIFPVFMYVFLLVPLLVLAGLAIWALPEARSVPEGAIEKMFFTFLVLLFLWPNYLAISLPGVPWITVSRLITLPMVVTFMISLSMSAKMRRELGSVLAARKWITACLAIFVATQTYTLAFSDLRNGLNKFIDSQTQWTGVFLVAAWLFRKPGRAEKLMKLLMICGFAMIVIALIEWRLDHVPWRDVIPGFLRPNDDSVDRILTGQRRAGVGVYRVQGTFSTALNLAEFLALIYSVVLYFLIAGRSLWVKLLLAVYIPASFFIIILTDSRIGAVGTAATLFISALALAYRQRRSDSRNVWAPAVLLSYPLAVAAFVALSVSWGRLRNLTWGGGQHQSSTDVRAEQWEKFWPALASWPFGFGVGEGAEQAGTISPSGVFTLDSYYIMQFLNFGIIGGLAYFAMFFAGATVAVKYGVRRKGPDEDLLLAGGMMLIVFLLSKLVLVLDDSHAMIFMVLGMVCALSVPNARDGNVAAKLMTAPS